MPMIAGISSAGLSPTLAEALLDAAALEDSMEQNRSFVSLTRVEVDCAVVLLEGGGQSSGRVVIPPSLWKLMIGRPPRTTVGNVAGMESPSTLSGDGFDTAHLKLPKLDKLYHELGETADTMLLCADDRASGGGELLTGEEERTAATRKILWAMRRHVLGIVAEAAHANKTEDNGGDDDHDDEEEEGEEDDDNVDDEDNGSKQKGPKRGLEGEARREGNKKRAKAIAERLRLLRLADDSLSVSESSFVEHFARSQLYAVFMERWFAGAAL